MTALHSMPFVVCKCDLVVHSILLFLIFANSDSFLNKILVQFDKHFGKYGEITDSVIMKDRFTGQPRGFGFITYADPSVVDKVIEDTHIINGKQVRVLMNIVF